MKRKEFVQKLKRDGCVLLRPGSRHDVYINPKTEQKQPVARHPDTDLLVEFTPGPLGVGEEPVYSGSFLQQIASKTDSLGTITMRIPNA